jgi:mono/diheme cytochrome c family protein
MRRSISALTSVLVLMIVIAPHALAQIPPQSPQEPSVDYWATPLDAARAMGARNHAAGHARQGAAPLHLHALRRPDGISRRQIDHWQFKGVIDEGARIYSQRCAGCHGKRGLGDGDAPRSLLPSPALLAFMIQRPIAVDEYLLWSIAEGGKQFETEMPAFKDTLNREDIWKIIAYMRAGFPEPGKVPALK